MSLQRYENLDSIISISGPRYAQIWRDIDLDILPNDLYIPIDSKLLTTSIPQIHIYSLTGDYILGDHEASYLEFDSATNSLLVNVSEVFRAAQIYRGTYIVVINLLKSVWGSPEKNPVFVRDISPDRTEIKLIVPSKIVGTPDHLNFISKISELRERGVLNNLAIDFGFNRISRILDVKFSVNDPSVIYLKLYKPVHDDIGEKNTGWFGIEVFDPYVDTVLLTADERPIVTNQLKGPNFDLDVDLWHSNSTIYKSWNDLLDTDVQTTNEIINNVISGSATARLNIDYTDFSNFIFYSSAKERIDNFYYKLSLIETYNENIRLLSESSGALAVTVSGSIVSNESRINKLISSFDHFERWLYYEPTSSLFTHDRSGSVVPYPKYLKDGRYVLHHTTSSEALAWYSNISTVAEEYDRGNYNRLWWSIPEHIVMDEGNSYYVTLVEMAGQFFDNIYMYLKALTDIHRRDEHPALGISNDLIWYKVKSFGWLLQNTHQIADLWKYSLGKNQSGIYEHTGSLFSLSGENQTFQIWRRIYNNLPFLLKTKGTRRSVRALMNIFGIPHTLISIKEYGGPSAPNDRPQWIEDRFSYAINVTPSTYLSLDRAPFIYSSEAIGVYPQTHEFRFRTYYSQSLISSGGFSSILSFESGSSRLHVGIRHSYNVAGKELYSGSYAFGDIVFTYGNTVIASSSLLPIFDNDFWTIRFHTSDPLTLDASMSIVNIDVARAKDCIGDLIVHSASLSVSISSSYLDVLLWANKIFLGSGSFSGSLQFYKEYYCSYDDNIFREHVLNPAAYYVRNPSASYDFLYRYFPLGGDVIRYDHTSVLEVSSSHPNQDVRFLNTIEFHNYEGGQSTQYDSVRETYYIYTPSIGGNNIKNNKIRIDDGRLVYGLSPTARGEISRYDYSLSDSNRLAIVFSLADQINRDIFNHSGFDELDQYIGDPRGEFFTEYPELRWFAYSYFKKYEQINNINSFIFLLSLYDYTFFEQIKQLVPARADLIAGILVEPHILERSKVKVLDDIEVENPQWEEEISLIPNNPEGEYKDLVASASVNYTFNVSRPFYSGSGYIGTGSFSLVRRYYEGGIIYSSSLNMMSLHHLSPKDQRTGLYDDIYGIEDKYSGSQSVTQSVIDGIPIQYCRYYCVEYFYQPSGTFSSNYEREWYMAVSRSYKKYSSRSLHPCGYQIDECGVRNVSRFIGAKMSSPDFNVDSPDTVDGGPVIEVIRTPSFDLLAGDDDTDSIFVE